MKRPLNEDFIGTYYKLFVEKCGEPQVSRNEQGQSVSLSPPFRFDGCWSLDINRWREDGVAGLFIAWLVSAILFGVAISSILIWCIVGSAFSISLVSINSEVRSIGVFWPEPSSHGIIKVQVFDLPLWQRSYQ